MSLIRCIPIALALFLLPAAVAAQMCPGGLNEGETDPNNACLVCASGVLTSLPPRTSCSEERRFQCDATGVFRKECVQDSLDPNLTNCEEHTRFAECPNGLACSAQGFCLASCGGTNDCRNGFECQDDVCVRVDVDPPDMGVDDMGGDDMGAGDMGTGDTDTSSDMGSADMEVELPDVGVDQGRPDMGGTPGGTKPKTEDGGCSTSGGQGSLAGLLLGLLLVWRRRD